MTEVADRYSGGSSGQALADNIVYFSRALRRAGLNTGPADAADAIAAVELIGIGMREEFHSALSAIFVRRHEDQPVFDEAFDLFWQRRDLVGKMIALMSPKAAPSRQKMQPRAGAARVADAFTNGRPSPASPEKADEFEMDARFTASSRDRLMRTDFAQMTNAELAEARRRISRLVLPNDDTPIRRYRTAVRPGRIDPRATMRSALRLGGDVILPRYRQRRMRPPPLVVLADISGSMSQYTRMFLHFLHLLKARRGRVHAFLFGTRLTNVTRQMRHRDPDEAVAAVSAVVEDWSGGTRIGETLKEFNFRWSRRVLGQGAMVLLVTDGLERDDTELLSVEMARLHRSCRRLIWLNPLLRFDGFEPRAAGVRAMLPHVDEFRAVHDLNSLSDLAKALGSPHVRDIPAKSVSKRILP